METPWRYELDDPPLAVNYAMAYYQPQLRARALSQSGGGGCGSLDLGLRMDALRGPSKKSCALQWAIVSGAFQGGGHVVGLDLELPGSHGSLFDFMWPGFLVDPLFHWQIGQHRVCTPTPTPHPPTTPPCRPHHHTTTPTTHTLPAPAPYCFAFSLQTSPIQSCSVPMDKRQSFALASPDSLGLNLPFCSI